MISNGALSSSQDSSPILPMVQQGLHSQQAVRALTVRAVSSQLEASSEACFREDLDPVPPALPGVESHLFCQPRSDGHYRRTEKYSQINLLSASF